MAEQKPKTKDTARKEEDNPTPEANQAGADQHLSDVRQSVVGDLTSSSAEANNPGQHGRDGGEINGVSNNPAPSEAAIEGTDETAASETTADEGEKKDEVKKL